MDSEGFVELKNVLDGTARKLEAEKASAKKYLENLARKLELENAYAVAAAKDAGLSDYAIGLVSGRTSHESRTRYIQKAFDLIAEHEAGVDE